MNDEYKYIICTLEHFQSFLVISQSKNYTFISSNNVAGQCRSRLHASVLCVVFVLRFMVKFDINLMNSS